MERKLYTLLWDKREGYTNVRLRYLVSKSTAAAGTPPPPPSRIRGAPELSMRTSSTLPNPRGRKARAPAYASSRLQLSDLTCKVRVLCNLTFHNRVNMKRRGDHAVLRVLCHLTIDEIHVVFALSSSGAPILHHGIFGQASVLFAHAGNVH